MKFLVSTLVNLVLIVGAWMVVSALMHTKGPSWAEIAFMGVGLVLVGLSKVVGGRLLAARRRA